MTRSFLNGKRPLLTVMVPGETPEALFEKIHDPRCQDADAFGLQAEALQPAYQNADTYQRLFEQMDGKPCYVTYYRHAYNIGKTDEEIADGIVTLAKSGAVLCDVMGDLFGKHPEELTEDAQAIQKQMALIDRLHELGAQVLMSSHLFKTTPAERECHFRPAERVLEIALEQKRRGADIIKIVTGADTMEQQLENLRTTDLLKRELGAPFLFLTTGECQIHRRIGMALGCCMSLCVNSHDALSTPTQPLLQTMKIMRDQAGF